MSSPVSQERWERERQSLNSVGDLKKRLDDCASPRRDLAQREANYEKASQLLYDDDPAPGA